MRILHTSDWHLGISTGPAVRAEEQEWFLHWLLELIKAREIDVLLIAGDVFDSMHPSADAQELYYRFLSQVGRAGASDVVVVGGNHDSPARLDAPRTLLQTVRVHVVGGLPAADDRADRMIAPLRRRGSDDAAAVCLAIPYVHEYRLGIRTSDLDDQATRAAFRTAFADLYRELADAAVERFGDVPLVATGHLTLGTGAQRDDYPQEIHQVGQIEGLPTAIIDSRIRYAALGHIHRCYPIGQSTAWYCGTPIAYSLTEMASPRQVLVVDLDGEAQATVERVEVPRRRHLVQLTGTPDAVLAELTALSWSTALPPLVHVRVETNMAEPGLARRLHEAVESHAGPARPILVEVQQRATELAGEATAPAVQALDELTPQEVFSLLCDARNFADDERQRLAAAFRQVEAADAETMAAMLAAIELPPTTKGDGS